jgi:hypothetical protein
MKKPPKPSHCDGLARQQLDEDLSRRLDIVPGEVQESFQPIRSLAADPKLVRPAWPTCDRIYRSVTGVTIRAGRSDRSRSEIVRKSMIYCDR